MKQNHSRPCLERMMIIAGHLISGHAFTTDSVAVECEVHYKTVARDIEFMRDRLGYKIEFNPARRSWVGRPPKARVL